MKSLLAIISSIFNPSSLVTLEKHEASMNFDTENIRPFLADLETKFKFGLDIESLVEFSESIEVEKEESKFFIINFNGNKVTMRFHVFMDDVDAPDLYFFFEHEKLATDVGDFMIEWVEARGM